MRNTNIEKDFLDKLRMNYETIYLNEAEYDIDNLVKTMSIFECPDFVGGEHYIEKFEVNAYKRLPNNKGKLSSQHLSDEVQMRSCSDKVQSIFSTTHYVTPPNETNTRNLKKNILDLVLEKTKKQKDYEKNYPQGTHKHLMIEIKSRCEILLGQKGNI